jgi:hypothetical protein
MRVLRIEFMQCLRGVPESNPGRALKTAAETETNSNLCVGVIR